MCEKAPISRIVPGPMTTIISAGKMQNSSGKRILTVTFCAFSLGPLTSDQPHLVGLLPQHRADRQAQAVGLHQRA